MQEPKKCPAVDIGGQAVMEGVMMKGPEAIAVAVRKPNGKIVVDRKTYKSPTKKHKWMGLPVIRGCVNMVSMLVMGMQVLSKSTEMLGVEEEEPSKFEIWLSKKLGANIDKVVMAVAGVMAIALSLFLFVFLPSGAATLAQRFTQNRILVNLASGFVRICILVLYIWLIGFMPELRRVFQYHGAEHKTVYCHEAGLELTPENAQKFSRLHPRCGTSFLLITMIISILVGSVIDQLIYMVFGVAQLTFLMRFFRSILLLPVVAGVAYEALKGLAHAGNHPVVRALRWPGLKLQLLTTREPDDKMLEVAIASMKAALYGVAAAAPAKQYVKDAPDEAQKDADKVQTEAAKEL